MASHSLLQRRFAPRKVVRLPSLFPVLFYSCIPDRLLRPFKNDRQVFKRHSLVPSFLSGGQNRNDDRRKNIIWLLAKNPAADNRKRVFNTRILCQILHFVQEWQASIYYRFVRNYSSVSAPICPFRQPAGWHFSQGKASHSLLLRRSAPRKVVRLLPDKRGQLAFPILFFVYSFDQLILL